MLRQPVVGDDLGVALGIAPVDPAENVVDPLLLQAMVVGEGEAVEGALVDARGEPPDGAERE